MTFLPTPEIKARMPSWCLRIDGSLHLQKDLPLGRAFTAEEVTDQSAGGGSFGTIEDYLRFYQAIFTCSPHNEKEPEYRLLSRESYNTLVTPILPFPYELRPPVDPLNPPIQEDSDARHQLSETVNMAFGWSPSATPVNLNYSVGFAIHTEDVPNVRPARTGGWFGLLRTPAFIDERTRDSGWDAGVERRYARLCLAQTSGRD